MSEAAGVEIRSPHEQMVEHAAESDGLAQRVALTTAILATVGALFGYQSGQVQTEALLLKNESIAKLTQASDQWGFSQAKSTREFLSRNIAETNADDKIREKYKKEAERYAREKEVIRKDAQRLTDEGSRLSEESESKIPPHERMALGVALMQVSVALASITVLTRKSWLFIGTLIFAAAGIGVASWGYMSVPASHHEAAAHGAGSPAGEGGKAESKPTEGKPAEGKPADSKPTESKSDAPPAGAH